MSPTPGDGVKVWLAFFWRESVIAKKGFEGEIAKKAWSRKNGHDGAIAKKFGHDGVITKKLGMMMAWLQKIWRDMARIASVNGVKARLPKRYGMKAWLPKNYCALAGFPPVGGSGGDTPPTHQYFAEYSPTTKRLYPPCCDA